MPFRQVVLSSAVLLTLPLQNGCAQSEQLKATQSSVAAPISARANDTLFKNEEAFTFVAGDAGSTEAFRGHLFVPENRNDPNTRDIRLEYVRFPGTGNKTGAPIIYLAGGPGGSGIKTAEHRRFPFFMAMREFGDVIAFDQRGTGASTKLPYCESNQIIDETRFVPDREFLEIQLKAAKECLEFWEDEGLDLTAYNTIQNALDLDDLRRHLNADQISLWGISYGSHLSLAALKLMQDRIDKVVLASVEGLDQTVKLPSRTDAYFLRLQNYINLNKADGEPDLDLLPLMRSVHAKLNESPMLLELVLKDGSKANYMLEKRDLQGLASGMISDPKWALHLVEIYKGLSAGNSGGFAGVMSMFYNPEEKIGFSPMSFAMDIASGTGAERLAKIQKQAENSTLGLALNFPMPQFEGLLPDLGDDFRQAPANDTPILALSGTLDGRTYPASQAEAVEHMPNAHQVIVENAGHNLFMSSSDKPSPEVLKVVQSFMRGEKVETSRITVELTRER